MYNQKQISLVNKILKKNLTNYWTGKECKEFEKEFSKYHNSKYAIAVSNGSVALELALRSLNLKKGDEIIVTPRSFIISASCVLNLGLKPIFADINSNGNLSLKGIKEAYNKNTKAIIIVHLNGLPCDMDSILSFVKKNKLFLIEDCSQAHGAIYKGKKVGTFGDVATWSFCQDKIISTGGEGGMILTNNKKLWLKIWAYKDHGKNYKKIFNKKHKIGFRWLHDELGSNYRMTEMQAAIGREQLKALDKQIKKRNYIAKLYLSSLKDFYIKYNFLKKPDFKCDTCYLKKEKKDCKKCTHSFYRLNFFINKKVISQSCLLNKLQKFKVVCGVGSCPEIYRENVFKKKNVKLKKRLANAKLLGETSLTFFINPYENIKNIKFKIKSIIKVFRTFL